MSEKVFLNAARTRVIVAEQAGEVIGSAWSHKVYDERYYAPPLNDALRIIEEARLAQLEYCDDISDCDDFHRRLVSVFLADAYRDKRRRWPYCFGTAESIDHAFNAMINDDLVLRFIEPQTGEIAMPDDLGCCLVEIVW